MFSDAALYQEDLRYIADFDVDWDKLKGRTILITGATGLIGTVLIDAIMNKNSQGNLGIKILALSRSLERLSRHFPGYRENPLFSAVEADVTEKLIIDENVDYVINLAGNTHPMLYSTEPINTILTGILGANNVLEFAASHAIDRVVNVSSVEVYGENRGDVRLFTEDYSGYINCNSLRAGYPEAKRVAEALSQAYIAEKGIDVVSARFGRVYGSTQLSSDTKSTSQFIRSAVNGEDIVLKSKGDQEYSYVYVADAVTALLILLTRASNGEAYNVASDEVKNFRETAEVLAAISGKNVRIELPTNTESKGFSVVQTALMDSTKIKSLGWRAKYSIKEGLERTVDILRSAKNDAN